MVSQDVFDLLAKLPVSRSGDRALRCSTNVGATIVLDGSHDRPLEVLAKNLSRTGILLRYVGVLPAVWAIGASVELVIEPDPRYFKQQVTCRGTIRRLMPEQRSTEPAVLIACQFSKR